MSFRISSSHLSQNKLCKAQSLHPIWNFISTFTGDERWPTEVTSNTYFHWPTEVTSNRYFHWPTEVTSNTYFHWPTEVTSNTYSRWPTEVTSNTYFRWPTEVTSYTYFGGVGQTSESISVSSGLTPVRIVGAMNLSRLSCAPPNTHVPQLNKGFSRLGRNAQTNTY